MKDLLKGLPKAKIIPEVYRGLPQTAGIYVFFSEGCPIYIGKAINLKRRVTSYFDINLEPKTARMMKDATELSIIRVSSELEALLLEARLIRTYMPKYNIAAKDDKHPLYIQITKEKYPRIITARKIAESYENLAFYGPFPSTRNVRSVLRMLRRIFPYSDHKLGKRRCLYSHIGLCNPCPSEIEAITDYKFKTLKRKEYLRNIRWVKAVLSAKFSGVQRELVKEMGSLSKEEQFEKAAVLRNKIRALDYITQPQMPTEFYMENPNLYEDIKARDIKQLSKLLLDHSLEVKNLGRIECFDVAHLAGTSPTASMVCFIGGEADKSFYRHFKIRQRKGASDIDSLREVMVRRIKHLKDWGEPDLIIVDGGKAQVKVFNSVLVGKKVKIPVVGIAKNPDRLIIYDQKIRLQATVLTFVQKIRNEAHRFAQRYHHTLVSKT